MRVRWCFTGGKVRGGGRRRGKRGSVCVSVLLEKGKWAGLCNLGLGVDWYVTGIWI